MTKYITSIKRRHEYKVIYDTYKSRTARRTKLRYMRHIDEGLVLLDHLRADEETMLAWCVHPLFQLDEFFVPMVRDKTIVQVTTSPDVLVLAMEYRSVANAYLTGDAYTRFPTISSIEHVNTMLIADKVQNFWDAALHLYPVVVDVNKRNELECYFQRWLDKLGVSANLLIDLRSKLSK